VCFLFTIKGPKPNLLQPQACMPDLLITALILLSSFPDEETKHPGLLSPLVLVVPRACELEHVESRKSRAASFNSRKHSARFILTNVYSTRRTNIKLGTYRLTGLMKQGHQQHECSYSCRRQVLSPWHTWLSQSLILILYWSHVWLIRSISERAKSHRNHDPIHAFDLEIMDLTSYPCSTVSSGCSFTAPTFSKSRGTNF
jgi:hypothetical protein